MEKVKSGTFTPDLSNSTLNLIIITQMLFGVHWKWFVSGVILSRLVPKLRLRTQKQMQRLETFFFFSWCFIIKDTDLGCEGWVRSPDLTESVANGWGRQGGWRSSRRAGEWELVQHSGQQLCTLHLCCWQLGWMSSQHSSVFVNIVGLYWTYCKYFLLLWHFLLSFVQLYILNGQICCAEVFLL